MKTEPLPELPVDSKLELCSFEGGPYDGREQYVNKGVEGMMLPSYEPDTHIPYYYCYWLVDGVYVWDRNKLNHKQAEEKMRTHGA